MWRDVELATAEVPSASAQGIPQPKQTTCRTYLQMGHSGLAASFSCLDLNASVMWSRRVEARVFGCIAVVRLLLVPAANLLLVRTLWSFRLLPRDPVCALTLLVQARCPSGSFQPFVLSVRGICPDKVRGAQTRSSSVLLKLVAAHSRGEPMHSLGSQETHVSCEACLWSCTGPVNSTCHPSPAAHHNCTQPELTVG